MSGVEALSEIRRRTLDNLPLNVSQKIPPLYTKFATISVFILLLWFLMAFSWIIWKPHERPNADTSVMGSGIFPHQGERMLNFAIICNECHLVHVTEHVSVLIILFFIIHVYEMYCSGTRWKVQMKLWPSLSASSFGHVRHPLSIAC